MEMRGQINTSAVLAPVKRDSRHLSDRILGGSQHTSVCGYEEKSLPIDWSFKIQLKSD